MNAEELRIELRMALGVEVEILHGEVLIGTRDTMRTWAFVSFVSPIGVWIRPFGSAGLDELVWRDPLRVELWSSPDGFRRDLHRVVLLDGVGEVAALVRYEGIVGPIGPDVEAVRAQIDADARRMP